MSDIDLNIDELDLNESHVTNRPNKDFGGYVKGKLVFIKTKQQNRKKFLRFGFIIEGTSEPIKMSKTTPNLISSDVIHLKIDGRRKREQLKCNALTEMCIKLGIFNIRDVKNNNNVAIDKLNNAYKTISEESPIYIKTKLERCKKFFYSRSYDQEGSYFKEFYDSENIDISTIKLTNMENKNVITK